MLFSKTTTVDPVIEDAVRRLQQGDRAAAGFLFDRYHDELVRWAQLKLRDATLAEDLAQETWATVLDKIDHYQEQAGKGFRAWLWRIASNVINDHFRKAARRNEYAADMADYDRPAGLAVEDQVTDRALVKAVLGTVTAKQRKALLMRNYVGASFADIGNDMGCTESNARVTYHRALAAARAHFPAPSNDAEIVSVVPTRRGSDQKEMIADEPTQTALGG